ncbi:hypothetical protein M514_18314 [Trichuris suis]|uniref:Zinc finger BED domain-containing protein 5 n=1 Tax=Trichuris suis TaxID=68888 RepID=A0A085NIZ6_9BILA|nr:hypothetical protein M514_18314 [Trichuris suis]
MTMHCVIHRRHLAAKHLSPRLNESLKHVITAVKEYLCDEKRRTVALRDILELRQANIAYLADLCETFNAMNLQLQVGNLNLMKTKSAISAFVSKLSLYKTEHLAWGTLSISEAS